MDGNKNTRKNKIPVQTTLAGKEIKEGKIHPKNALNNLTGREWIKFTKSWFIEDGKNNEISDDIKLHPASFPPSLVAQFINFFTKENEYVLDMFLGTGSTLVACDRTGRRGVGIELVPKYVNTACKRVTKSQKIIEGDAKDILDQLQNEEYRFNLCINSPPYWNILRKDKDYTQKERMNSGLDTHYSENEEDLGNIGSYKEYLEALENIYLKTKKLLKPEGFLVIITQNVRHKGETVPIAFDITKKLQEHFNFLGEKIWCQSQKTLRPYGYPFTFVPNVHHHYCLIFQNPHE